MTSMKTDAKISHWQLFALLSIVAFFAVIVPLPDLLHATAKFGVAQGNVFSMSRFVTLSVSTAIMSAIFLPLLLYSAKYPDNVLAPLPKWLKKVFAAVLILRLLYGAVYTVLQINSFLVQTILTYLTPVFLVIPIFAAALYGSYKGVQSTARIASPAVFVCVLTVIALSLMMWSKMDVIQLYSPIGAARTEGGHTVFGRIVADVAGNDALFVFIALSGVVRTRVDKEKDSVIKPQSFKAVLYSFPLILVLALWLNVIYNAILGRYVSAVLYPLYVVSTYSSFNLLERMDGIIATIVIIGGILKITLFLICIRILLGETVSRELESRKPIAKIITLIMAVIAAVWAYALIGKEPLTTAPAVKYALLACVAIAALLLPLIAVIFARRTKKNAQKHCTDTA